MHEAGLANAIAMQLREARQAGLIARPRLVVRGGHDRPADFDAALRLHLAQAAPELGDERLEIVHEPVARLCSSCSRTFSADDPLAPCPSCGSAALPTATSEEVELEWATGKAV
jgi:Zn finger protein HypA/HybF involved in hydrogenase expression